MHILAAVLFPTSEKNAFDHVANKSAIFLMQAVFSLFCLYIQK